MKYRTIRELFKQGGYIAIPILCGIVLCAFTVFGQEQHFSFKHLSTSDGLSMANANAIARDVFGFMWFGTEDGLNRYDGYQFIIYHNNVNDEHSLSNSYIEALLYDRKDRLWVGTRDGLNRYVPEKDQFVRYTAAENDLRHPNNRDVKNLFEDSKGNIWIIGDVGADCMDTEQETFRHFRNDPKDLGSLSYNTAYQIAENKRGKFWIATERGLNLLDPVSGKCQRFYPDPKNPNSLGSAYIRSILVDPRGNLWIGTYGKGLDFFNISKNQFVHFPFGLGKPNAISHNQVNKLAFHWDGNLWVGTTEGLNFVQINPDRLQDSRIFQYLEDANNPHSLSASHIQSIWVDSSRIWLATRFGGVNIYDKYGTKFEKYSIVSGSGNGLSHLNVTSFTEDDQGQIFIGTDGGGVNIFNPATRKFGYLKHDDQDPNSLFNNKVLSVLYEAPNTLWIGMWDGGVDRYNLSTGRMVHYGNDPADKGSLSGNNVFYLFLDRHRQLWVGTWSAGLNRYDRASDRFIRYPFIVTNGTGTSGQTVVSMYEDRQGKIWIATEGQGLNRYDRRTKRFTYYQNDPKDTTTLSGNYVIAIIQDRKDRLWVTTTNGLNLFDPKTEKFNVFHIKHGLPAETLYGICEDDDGNLWISSIKGLSKVTVREMHGKTAIQCVNYSLQDGLQGEQYGQWAYFNNREGTMYFGGLNGFNRFHPKDIRRNPIIPKVLINNLQLSMRPVSFKDPHSPITKPMYLTDLLTLSYKETMLTFDFIAISFTQPENNQYAYLLENFDKKFDWHYVGTDRRATYTNLDPGKYIFRVKASNNDGVWNESGTALRLVIKPPFWRKPWFISLMIIFVLCTAYTGYKWRIRAMEAHRRNLEQQIAQRTDELKAKTEEIASSYQKLSETGRSVAVSSQMVNQATAKINEAMHEVKAGAISQNEFVNQTRQLIDSLLSTIHSVTYETKTSTKAAEKTVQAVESGTASMQGTLNTMQSLEKIVNDTWETMKDLMAHSSRIDGIVQFIDDVASRVNVLALNALIEAVRAGEYGRGFMVVAQEIRDLAKSTAHSTVEITEFITKIQKDVGEIEKITVKGLDFVKESAKFTDEGRATLTQICKSVEQEKERLSVIAAKVSEMQNFSLQVQNAINSVASVSEKNRENVEKVNNSTNEVGLRIQELSNLAQALNTIKG